MRSQCFVKTNENLKLQKTKTEFLFIFKIIFYFNYLTVLEKIEPN